jgi:hypothetical protein
MDHLGRARELRERSSKCDAAANEATSAKFKSCYHLLAQNYQIQAGLEEEFAASEQRLRLSPSK